MMETRFNSGFSLWEQYRPKTHRCHNSKLYLLSSLDAWPHSNNQLLRRPSTQLQTQLSSGTTSTSSSLRWLKRHASWECSNRRTNFPNWPNSLPLNFYKKLKKKNKHNWMQAKINARTVLTLMTRIVRGATTLPLSRKRHTWSWSRTLCFGVCKQTSKWLNSHLTLKDRWLQTAASIWLSPLRLNLFHQAQHFSRSW